MKSKVKSEVNLWNLGSGKTKEVIKYIENLEPLVRWKARDEVKKIKEFDRRIRVSLSKRSANEMLTSIGYRFGKRPEVYNTVEGMKKGGTR